MLQTSEHETEILLGNKQLLGIFFVVAVLLGVAFTGGYMVGRGSGDKKVAATIPAEQPSVGPAQPVGGVTHSVQPSDPTADGQAQTAPLAEAAPAEQPPAPEPKAARKALPQQDTAEPLPLGSPKHKADQKSKADDSRKKAVDAAEPPSPVPAVDSRTAFVPQNGQSFLQVAAVGRDEAEAVADVLRRKGFKAHAVPKPGNLKIYRVLIGPIHDAADLSSTRDSLRTVAGFREVIVQKY